MVNTWYTRHYWLQGSILWALLFMTVAAVNGQNKFDTSQTSSSSPLSSSAAPVSPTSQHKIPTPLDDCDAELIGFELITGYVFSAPATLLDSIPGTLMLTDCLEICQGNDTCLSVNYETGLCVLFNSNADLSPRALTRSQFPVFTIYAQKNCLGVKPCERAWCIDRVQNYRLHGYIQRQQTAESRQECLEMCLGETEFTCRSANYHNASHTCELSTMDRLTLSSNTVFQPADGYDYLENHCVDEPNKLCEFKKLGTRILKTVDSVYQDVGSLDECRELCINSPYRCRSYDYGDTGEMVCRLSHHSRATLADIQDPYLEVPEAATYELHSCYNVTIDCRSGEMGVRIQTSKLFNGKIYAKGSPNSCVQNVNSTLEFGLSMSYDNLECNVRKHGLGRYVNDVVIQHHATIVTSSDLGLAVTCQYDLTNKSVTNEVDLGVHGDIQPTLSEEVTVDSPNVAMKITDRSGGDIMSSAEVGDPLALRFEIIDKNSPYEIFVRELVAMDGVDSSEIVLIDSNGCPTDHFIMGPLYKSLESGKILLSHFDAFKFPSSEIVQFRALVTPCMPSCEPVQCDQEDTSSAELRSVMSYGRRRRRRSTSSAQEDLLLVQSIQITDKFGFQRQDANKTMLSSSSSLENDGLYYPHGGVMSAAAAAASEISGLCINMVGLIVAAAVFLSIQLVVAAIWTCVWQRRRSYHRKLYGSHDNMSVSVSLPPPSPFNTSGRSDSLCKLYDAGSGYTAHSRRY